MADRIDSLPDDVVEAWKGGNKIEAIRRLREAAHMGLAEAKAVIDALDRATDGSAPATASVRVVSGPAVPDMMKALQEAGALPPDVMEAWQRGAKLEALKRFAAAAKEGRIQGNVKVRVEVNERRQKSGALAPPTDASTPAMSARTSVPDNGLAPGEVPRSKGGATAALVLLAVVVIALVIYARYG